ncbi:hypothetical protein AMECASPLE_024753 [Ameca splendens]|uniref:Uncharacterized protein n=1 Tax=Ameca splendens TaxID=208324 RepID=A0ABV0XHD6_9TELE
MVPTGIAVCFNDSFHSSTRKLFLTSILENSTVGWTNTLGGRAGEAARSVISLLSPTSRFSLTLQMAMCSVPAGMISGPGPVHLTSATGESLISFAKCGLWAEKELCSCTWILAECTCSEPSTFWFELID